MTNRTSLPIPQSELYRYEWSIEIDSANELSRLLVVMKNPSYPDEQNICFKKAVAWARARAFGAVDFVNLFARRSYDPRSLNALSYDDAVGRDNDYMIGLLAEDADLVIAAWGQPSGIRANRYRDRVEEVTDLLGLDRLTCLDTTSAGHPKHPQVWSSSWTLRDWHLEGVRW